MEPVSWGRRGEGERVGWYRVEILRIESELSDVYLRFFFFKYDYEV